MKKIIVAFTFVVLFSATNAFANVSALGFSPNTTDGGTKSSLSFSTSTSEGGSSSLFDFTPYTTEGDIVPPSITAPSDIFTDATGTTTSVTLGSASSSDDSGFDPIITNDAPAGFVLGTTTVVWTATDRSGNTSTATQVIVITAKTDPIVTPEVTPPAPSHSSSGGSRRVISQAPQGQVLGAESVNWANLSASEKAEIIKTLQAMLAEIIKTMNAMIADGTLK